MDKLKKINDENKFLNQMREKQHSLGRRRQEGDSFKENPIEYRLRTDFMNKKIKNKIQERDILAYNAQAVKQRKIKNEYKKVQDKFYSEQFNEHVENQAATYLLNRTNQQGKYETKRQDQDLLAFKERTLKVKRQLDEIISKNSSSDPSDREELLKMQGVLKTCLCDIEKAEKVHPTDPNSLTREVNFKANMILDWQVHNKKISEIEDKLNDKEYKNYLQWQADNEIDIMNKEIKLKRERQNKYLSELQTQEKQQKRLK